MYRRQVLAGTGALTLGIATGCLGRGDDTGTDGDDDDPFEVEPDELLMTAAHAESVLDDDWDRGERIEDDRPMMYSDADVAQTIVPFDGEELRFEDGRIFNGVWLADTVDGARDIFEEHPYYYGHGLEEESIAVDSLAGMPESTRGPEMSAVLFRDANAVGGVSFRKDRSSEDELVDVALELAANMHDGWRE